MGLARSVESKMDDASRRHEKLPTAVAFEDATVVKVGLNGEDLMSAIEQDSERIGGGSVPMAISMRGHAILIQDFVDAIRERRAPMVPANEARMSVDALNKVYGRALPGQKIGL